MIRRALTCSVACAAACGPWQRVGTPDRAPPPSVVVQRLFDATTVYQAMGFFATNAPLPMVASIHHLAGPTPDSTLIVFGLSFANHALSFHRDGNEFVGEYHVDVSFQTDSGATRQFGRDETVRVHSFQETLRADESVIFQQFALVHPGVYTVAVVVRDRNSAAMARQQRPDTVPAFAGAAVGSPVTFYEGSGREALSAFPKLLLSPRATLPYGADSLRVYVEAYGATAPARLAVRAVDDGGHDVWSDTVPARGDARLATAVVVLPAERLPIGQAALEVQLVGAAATARAPFLVSFSNQWVVNNFEQMVSLLRYFPHQDWVAKLRDAPAEQRAQVWRDFWKATDPVPITPENEALDQYFERVQIATQRYREEGAPGWLTDRGEVFITLGDPDDVYDLSNEMGRGGIRVIRWTYTQLRLTLFFEDQSGFGRYRLTPTSRADYQSALSRVRRAQ